MFILASYQSGRLTVDPADNYPTAHKQMETEYQAVLDGEFDVQPESQRISQFDAEIVFGETGHWIWRITEL